MAEEVVVRLREEVGDCQSGVPYRVDLSGHLASDKRQTGMKGSVTDAGRPDR